MKVAVLGSGVVGVATAYFLAKSGCEVTVIDRQEGAALETSFANAGEVSPGYSAPWAANLGGGLIWWDRLFGTYVSRPASDQRTMPLGLSGYPPPRANSLKSMLLDPFSRPG